LYQVFKQFLLMVRLSHFGEIYIALSPAALAPLVSAGGFPDRAKWLGAVVEMVGDSNTAPN
jgi:hypothetical protein